MKESYKLKVASCRILKLIIFGISLLTFHFLLLTSSLSAEEKAVKLEDIIVTASKIEEPVEETTSAAVVIKNEDIKKMNVEFVTDILRKIPEINLVQNGGAGGNASVFLRGGDSTHTLVMIDGVKIKSTTTGSFDFSGITVDDIERIEIVKGPQSTLYGSEAVAGVINIITKKGKDKPRVDASLEAGSFGTYKPSITFSGGDKRVDYRLTGTYFYTDGISAAKNGAEKDGYKNAAISGKLGLKPSERLELEFSGRYYYDRSDLDGFDFLQRQAVDDLNFTQHGNHYIFSGKGKLYLLNIWEQILTLSKSKDSLKGRDPDDLFNNYDITTGMDIVDWQHNLYPSEIYTLTAGIEYRREKGENAGNFERTVDNKAIYFNNKLKLFKERLIFNAGLRYDDHETAGSETTYRLGAIYNIEPLTLKIRGGYGTGFRAPTFNELFFPFYGNPSLNPEESRSWEAGIEKEISKNSFISLTYFKQWYKNLIQTDPFTFTAENIAEAEVTGIEADTKVKLTDNIDISAGYTRLDTEDKSTGKRLSRRPKDKFDLKAGFSMKDFSFVADYTFVGKRFDSSVDRNLSPYSLVNLSGTYKMTKEIILFARVDNLFDKDYEEAGSYGTPGFSIFGGIKISL